jgi:4-hydroxy-tetrahydrodipicolinate synthase
VALIDRDTSGVFAISPTPFGTDGSIDWDSLDRLVDFYEGAGVSGLTILGQLGEAPKLSQDESVQIIERVLSTSSVPVVVGVTSPGLAGVRHLTEAAMGAGAAGVMVAPSLSLRTDEQIVRYFHQVASAIGPDVPLVLQDYPLTFGVVISPAVISGLASSLDNLVMLKHEDWPGLSKITALRAAESAGEAPRLSILCGNGGLFLDFELERGADGAMTGYCFPEMLVDLVRLNRSGDRAAAHDLFDAHLPLVRYEQQPGLGLAVRKYVMVRRGLLSSDAQRVPAASLSQTDRAEIDLLLERLAAMDSRALGAARNGTP